MNAQTLSRFEALFDPRGVIVAGASSHPGKFGFVVLHNILRHEYGGKVFATNVDGGEILGVTASPSVECIPDGAADLVFVCTPVRVNADLVRDCARKGVRAAFVMTGGYAEAGDAGRRAEQELAAVAEQAGVLLAGPNGQGIVSTPSSLCAQMVAPYPPAGRIGVASQSGNIVSTFENLALSTGVGISRAVSAGNAAAVEVADYLEYFATDPATDVGLAYLEGVRDGRALFDALSRAASEEPLVLVHGGSTAGGRRAAASHTGSLATDGRIFAGMCRQAGVNLASTVEEAFEAAATFATQPLPRGPNVAVLTTAGGWGVLTADALARSELALLALPDDLLAAIDALLPPRWSRGNPIDLAAAETRDTIPQILELLAAHDSVDAILFIGSGVQSNQAKLMRTGAFASGHDLERIVEFHERQDARYARVAADVSAASGKPILVATELAVTDPDNPGPRTVRETGKVCYWSANRAVTALEHLWRRARFLDRRGRS
jgi:acyl-CoA synthetase (NDP forming)